MPNYGAPVTDPELLKQLEAGGDESPSVQYGQPVTDPALLKQLESSENQPSGLGQLPLSMRMMADVPLGFMELRNALRNAPHNIAGSLAKHGLISEETAGKFPGHEYPNYGEALGLTNPSDRLVQSLSKNLPSYFIPGIGEGAMIAPLTRIAGQGLWGALTNKNPEEGAEAFGGAQAAGEALPLPFRMLKGLGEQFMPLKYTEGKIKQIADFFKTQKNAQKEAYSYMNPYKEDWVSVNPKKVLDPEDVSLFPKPVKKRLEMFHAEPSLENAHRLQSQMGASQGRIKGADQYSNDVKDALKDSRNTLQDMIRSHLSFVDKNAANQYEEGRRITRDVLEPTRSTPTLRKITRGTITGLTPDQLVSTIRRGYESEKIPMEHELMKHLQDIQMKSYKGKALQTLLPMGLGAAAGSLAPDHAMLGMGLGGLGGALGAGALKFLTPGFTQLAQNPWLMESLRKLKAPAQAVPRTAAGYTMYGE